MTTRLAAVCAEKLISEARRDRGIWLLDGDLADSYGALAFADQLPDRFVMAGIAEQNMVSMAAGMASCGAKPWVFSFAAFLIYRAADQIRVSVAQTGMNVALVGSHAGGCGGRNGKTHQTTGDLAVIGSLPGIEVWTPCDAADTAFAVDQILAHSGPSYIRAPRDGCPALNGRPGPLRWLTPQAEIILLCSGLSAHWALEVSRDLASQDFQIGVLHVGRFAPLPEQLGAELDSSKQWFAIEDHVQHGGLAEAAGRLTCRPSAGWFGWPADWAGGSGGSNELRAACGLDTARVAQAIRRRL